MQEFSNTGDQVSEVGQLQSISSDTVHSLLESNNSQESTFSGLEVSNPGHKHMQSSTASSSSHKEKSDKAHSSKYAGKIQKLRRLKSRLKGALRQSIDLGLTSLAGRDGLLLHLHLLLLILLLLVPLLPVFILSWICLP